MTGHLIDGPSTDSLRYAAHLWYGIPVESAVKVLMIAEGPEGIVASCTEQDPAEIRGLMFRAGTALPERTT